MNDEKSEKVGTLSFHFSRIADPVGDNYDLDDERAEELLDLIEGAGFEIERKEKSIGPDYYLITDPREVDK